MITSTPLFTHSLVEVERGVVAGGHRLAAEAGVRVMQAGGNAIDALVAAAFTSFVVEPASCGIGGYGHISIYLAGGERFVSIDAYGRAPLRASAAMFEAEESTGPTYYGHPFSKGNKAMTGPLAIAVPGAVAGFCEAHAAFGRLPLPRVLEPAIEAAEAGTGFTFSDGLSIAARLAAGDRIEGESARMLLPGGRAPVTQFGAPAGERLDTSALARTLQAIAKDGAAAFYSGAIAKALGQAIASLGGILGEQDLAAYRTRKLAEQPLAYRGLSYISCFDQVAYEALNILDGFDLARFGEDSAEARHLIAEALAIAFADSMRHYGDPDFVKSPVKGLASRAFADLRRKLIDPDRALPRPVEAGDPWAFEAEGPGFEVMTDARSLARRDGTSQVATADAEGNMASVCMSLGSSFGSLVYVPEVGCFMNNAMQNYDPRPGLPNSIAPGKMPIFAAPAIVAAQGGRGRLAASGSGGYRIETGVLHAMMNVVDHGMGVQAAVDHPRVHCQGGPTSVDVRVPGEVIERLRSAGHEVIVEAEAPGRWPFGRVCAVTWDEKRKVLSGGAGPSWQTSVAGW